MPTPSVASAKTEYIRSALNNVTPKVSSGNALVMGIATSGPVNTPITFNNKEDAYAVFGKNITEVFTVDVDGDTVELTYIPNSLISIETYNTESAKYESATTIKDLNTNIKELSFSPLKTKEKIRVTYNIAYDRYSLLPKIIYLLENGLEFVTAIRITGEHAAIEIPSVSLIIQATTLIGTVTLQDEGNTVTITPNTVTEGECVYFTEITDTTGVEINTQYYAVNVTGDTFQLLAESDGSMIELTTNGTGTLSYKYILTTNREELSETENATLDSSEGLRIYKDADVSQCSSIINITESKITVDTPVEELLTDDWVIGYPLLVTIPDAIPVMKDVPASPDVADKYYVTFLTMMRDTEVIALHAPTWSPFTDTMLDLSKYSTLGSLVDGINSRYYKKQSEFIAYTPNPFAPVNFQKYMYYLEDGEYGVSGIGDNFICDETTWYDYVAEALNHVSIKHYNAIEFTVV